MSRGEVKFALIGCGRISTTHLDAMGQLSQAKLVAVCDINEEKARQTGEKYKVPNYTFYNKMLQKEDIDLVSIATPNGTHHEIAKDCAEQGKHVLLEKPMAITLKDADDLISTFRDSNLHLFTVLQVRYNNTLQLMKKLIMGDKLGKITTASAVIRWTRPQEYFTEWRGTKDMDGGAVINQGIHYIDILQWLLGPVKRLYAIANTVNHNIEIEDEAIAVIEFKNNVMASYEFTINTYPKNMECSLTVLGTKGTIKIGGTAMNEIEYWDVEEIKRPEIETIRPNVYAKGLYQGSCPNHLFIYEDVMRILTHGGTNYISGEESRKSLEIVKAIYKSAETGKPIPFLE